VKDRNISLTVDAERIDEHCFHVFRWCVSFSKSSKFFALENLITDESFALNLS
jgi:hypothetical protein